MWILGEGPPPFITDEEEEEGVEEEEEEGCMEDETLWSENRIVGPFPLRDEKEMGLLLTIGSGEVSGASGGDILVVGTPFEMEALRVAPRRVKGLDCWTEREEEEEEEEERSSVGGLFSRGEEEVGASGNLGRRRDCRIM